MSILYLVTIRQRSYIVSVRGFIKKKKGNLQMLLSKYISQFSTWIQLWPWVALISLGFGGDTCNPQFIGCPVWLQQPLIHPAKVQHYTWEKAVSPELRDSTVWCCCCTTRVLEQEMAPLNDRSTKSLNGRLALLLPTVLRMWGPVSGCEVQLYWKCHQLFSRRKY